MGELADWRISTYSRFTHVGGIHNPQPTELWAKSRSISARSKKALEAHYERLKDRSDCLHGILEGRFKKVVISNQCPPESLPKRPCRKTMVCLSIKSLLRGVHAARAMALVLNPPWSKKQALI
ncbi:hypothetical protein BU16DRAFT_44570 [Lophium mytilinum]|uniref:Uncharacterized protein n=1 Tax=Lophium mytilinum TaxID=390894 RepID=A0A6A6QSB1_9PEZI|nr:hypothetical protein BU16DRAFT_44570 [Lophium mytilinum]